ncbi:MAG TPA: hypothetical protein VL357_10265 [Rariglobus sp.]|nr:hypothetical protein [Rariglobus sp.]
MILPPKTSHPKAGFALLITITLLAFLVLLLVSLATLTRVETQVATNNQQVGQARQNALMALNIAIGQLQKFAGPDQRTTATADLASGDTSGNAVADGATAKNVTSVNSVNNGLGAVQAGTRYWTGSWGNSDQATDIYNKTPSPVLLNWLISGNEKTTFLQPDLTSGQITGSNGGSSTIASKFTPALTISNLSTSSDALATNLTITPSSGGNTVPAVLLVGPKSVATAAPPTTADLDHYVAAPLVDITSNQVPGLTGTPTVGRYAWWVGDEGVKAKYNLVDQYAVAGHTDAKNDIQARYRLLTAPRSGVETITGFSNYPLPISSTLATHANLAKIVELNQAGMLDPTLAQSTGIQALHGSYHDFTTHSLGLLTDSQRGGLRKDLTALLSDTTHFNNVLKGTPVIGGTSSAEKAYSPKLISGGAYVPQWDVVKSWSDLAQGVNDTNSVEIRATTDTQMGISPIISQIRILVGVRLPNYNLPKQTSDCVYYTVNPLIVLANPYPVTLTAPASTLTLTFRASTDTNTGAGSPTPQIQYLSTIVDPITGKQKEYNVTNMPIFDNTNNANNPSILTGVIFSFPAISIPAGEARAYYVNNHISMDSSNASATRTIPLTEITPSTIPSGFPGAECPVPANKIVDLSPDPAADPAKYPKFRGILGGGAGFGIAVELSRIGSASDTKAGRLQWIQRNEFYNTGVSGTNGYNRPDNNPDTGTSPRIIPSPGGWAQPKTFAIFQYIIQATYPDQTSAAYSPQLLGYKKNISLRIFQDFNLRGASVIKPVLFNTAPPYFPYYSSTNDTGNGVPENLGTYMDNTVPQPHWGLSNRATNVFSSVLFDLPRANIGGGEVPLFSIGQLQHVNLSADDYFNNAGHQPAYIVGDGYASNFVSRNLTIQPRDDNGVTSSGSLQSPPFVQNHRYFDMSYLVNTSLWDNYYFSTVPRSGSPTPVNHRLIALPDPNGVITQYDKAGGVLTVDGAFNINSTSVAAWTAVLGGTKSLPKLPKADTYQPPQPSSIATNSTETDSLASTTATYPRMIWQPGDSKDAGTVTSQDAYNGFRRLTPAQVSTLAQTIVKQVRLRGPFVSLAHFVNRTLISEASDTTNKLGLAGPLQSAIDSSGLNQTSTDPTNIGTVGDRNNVGEGFAGQVDGMGAMSMFADTSLLTSSRQSEQGSRSTSIPGWLTQGDLLQVMGPVIAARSDTFIIRTYGEVRNPLDPSSTTPVSRAWCEAVVQRVPQYINADSTNNSAEKKLSDTNLSSINKQFGRAFHIVSFRWLSPDDI